jgi:uroporphyrinogen decarboxylase
MTVLEKQIFRSDFTPDYRNLVEVLHNRRPGRLPLYEHIISPEVMERILGTPFASLENGSAADLAVFFREYARFFKEMTYDTVSYEVCLTEVLPGHGAIFGGRPGPIQNRKDFESYPWEHLPELYWAKAEPRFDALAEAMPPGMKAVGGVGNGVFELSEDLVGYEHLAYMQVDDPELFADLFRKIGELMLRVWGRFLERYTETYAVCRFGDDLGFRSSTLLAPTVIRTHIIPQYHRVIGLIRAQGMPFLWHSCGRIFEIMEDVISLGIGAKHSNEDAIAPFETWIERYGGRIGLLGGIDVDFLCQKKPEEIFEIVLERGRRYRDLSKGFALGSGNSIPNYVPPEGYLAMVRAVMRIREEDGI